MAVDSYEGGAELAGDDDSGFSVGSGCKIIAPLSDPVVCKATEVSTGTTIMAFRFDGGVILACDTRTSAGATVVNRACRKIVGLQDKIYLARSGSAADTQFIGKLVSRYLSLRALGLSGTGAPSTTPSAEGAGGAHIGSNQQLVGLPSVKSAASLTRLIAYVNKNMIMAGMIIAGWDPLNGYSVFHIPLGGTLLPCEYAIGGSGSSYIASLVRREFRSNMTKEDSLAFAKRCIAHAMTADGFSGGLIRFVIITQDGVDEGVVLNDDVSGLL